MREDESFLELEYRRGFEDGEHIGYKNGSQNTSMIWLVVFAILRIVTAIFKFE